MMRLPRIVVEYSNPRRFLYPYLNPYLLTRLINRLLKNVRNSACNFAVVDFLAIQQSFKLHRELFLELFHILPHIFLKEYGKVAPDGTFHKEREIINVLFVPGRRVIRQQCVYLTRHCIVY